MAEKRDPRAHWLDEDPFDQMNNNSKTHTRTRDDGNWRKPHIRVVHKNISGQPFFRSFNSRQTQTIPIHKGSIWHFSKIEIEHLIQATMAFTLALAFMTVGGIFGALNAPYQFIIGGLVYFVALAPAFLLHEIKLILPDIKIYGFDISSYAISKSKNTVKKNLFVYKTR